jgi:hypothetical protein
LLHQLAAHSFAGVTPGLKADIEQFYANPASQKRNPKNWARTQRELTGLRAAALTASGNGEAIK